MGGSRAARLWLHLYPSPAGFFFLSGDSSLAPFIPHYLRRDKTQLPKVHVGRSPYLDPPQGETGEGTKKYRFWPPRVPDAGKRAPLRPPGLTTDMTKELKSPERELTCPGPQGTRKTLQVASPRLLPLPTLQVEFRMWLKPCFKRTYSGLRTGLAGEESDFSHPPGSCPTDRITWKLY